MLWFLTFLCQLAHLREVLRWLHMTRGTCILIEHGTPELRCIRRGVHWKTVSSLNRLESFLTSAYDVMIRQTWQGRDFRSCAIQAMGFLGQFAAFRGSGVTGSNPPCHTCMLLDFRCRWSLSWSWVVISFLYRGHLDQAIRTRSLSGSLEESGFSGQYVAWKFEQCDSFYTFMTQWEFAWSWIGLSFLDVQTKINYDACIQLIATLQVLLAGTHKVALSVSSINQISCKGLVGITKCVLFPLGCVWGIFLHQIFYIRYDYLRWV